MERKEFKLIVGTFMAERPNETVTRYYEDGAIHLLDYCNGRSQVYSCCDSNAKKQSPPRDYGRERDDVIGFDVPYTCEIKILNGTKLSIVGFEGSHGVECCASVARVRHNDGKGWQMVYDQQVLLHGQDVIIDSVTPLG